MRAIWSGSIGFGLVNIPVKLYSATQESRLDLDMLDRHDLANIKFQRINEQSGKVVAWGDIVKGYKYNDEYVVLDDKDFEKANAKKTKVIEILAFANESEIDSIYFETPYYLEPDKSGTHAYALLREALMKTKRVGVSAFVLRNKEHLAIVKPMANVIVLNRIRYQQEIRDANELNLPDSKNLKPEEIKMAITLIDQLTQKFDISTYRDSYNDELMNLIAAKSKGKKLKVKTTTIAPTKTNDLMEQLKASLSRTKKEKSEKK